VNIVDKYSTATTGAHHVDEIYGECVGEAADRRTRVYTARVRLLWRRRCWRQRRRGSRRSVANLTRHPCSRRRGRRLRRRDNRLPRSDRCPRYVQSLVRLRHARLCADERENQVSLADLLPQCNFHRRNATTEGCRYVKSCLIGLERQQWIAQFDHIARLDEQLNDRNVLEIPMSGTRTSIVGMTAPIVSTARASHTGCGTVR
jgi:hypothetical protein